MASAAKLPLISVAIAKSVAPDKPVDRQESDRYVSGPRRAFDVMSFLMLYCNYYLPATLSSLYSPLRTGLQRYYNQKIPPN